MRQDPRVIRWSVLKLAERPEELAAEGKKVMKGSNLTAEDLVDP